MIEAHSSQEAFRIWTEQLQTPHATVAGIRSLIREYVASVARSDRAKGEELEAELFERARMRLTCTDVLDAVREEFAEAEAHYCIDLNVMRERVGKPRPAGTRKSIPGGKRTPAEYR